jgi:hypothetical protein
MNWTAKHGGMGMDYDIKKGKFAEIEGDGLRRITEETFGNAKMEGDMVVTSFGALDRMETKTISKTQLFVCTKMRKDVSDDVATETIKRYNQFLEKATGFNAKERGKRAQKKVKQAVP